MSAEKTTPGLLPVLDIFAWAAAIFMALLLRFDFDADQIHVPHTLLLIAGVGGLQIVFGWLTWLYRARYAIGSFEEVRALLLCAICVTVPAAAFIFTVGYGYGIPRTVPVMAGAIAFTEMGLARYLVRLRKERKLKPGAAASRVLLYGAGYAGTVTARRLLTDQAAGLVPVGFLDDNPAKRNVDVRGVRVLGSLSDLAEVAAKTRASRLIVCIGDADASLLRRVSELADRAGLSVLVMPPLDRILSGTSAISDVREISIEDLIGRHPVRLENESIATYLTGKRVLVTGAGGSIGSELCRQLMQFGLAEIMLLDRDETALQQTQISIRGNGLLDSKEVILADIRDPESLHTIFAERRPEVVFHAAALKHLPMLEQYPDEAWKTNVLGTLNVLRAAEKVGVETFVNISTDKAANPTSVLGHSKRVAEKLTAFFAQQTGGRYLSVRFGNVIGSRGSMLPTFVQLIEQGGPITITHPDVTRFFMTIPEACQLVIQAGGIGRPGEVLILDMGEPVRIVDIAKRMIAQSGKQIEIVYTGLRQGEKLHEELIGDDESDERPFHRKISHASVAAISPERLDYAGWFERLELSPSPQEAVTTATVPIKIATGVAPVAGE
ncbi:MAG: nucleoside-diphosphate sugar epimerase/dehydratase [Microbacteriaceae bacterium]|nr:nucleoside-diphosphate sugar epimerase/dehydratase [Microbacteriaceae bacterium]